jgi:hypothetical protein
MPHRRLGPSQYQKKTLMPQIEAPRKGMGEALGLEKQATTERKDNGTNQSTKELTDVKTDRLPKPDPRSVYDLPALEERDLPPAVLRLMQLDILIQFELGKTEPNLVILDSPRKSQSRKPGAAHP